MSINKNADLTASFANEFFFGFFFFGFSQARTR